MAIVAYKFGPQAEPLRRSKLENGQATYQVLVNIQVGRQAYQIYEDQIRVMVPISKPQIVYITLIVTIQENIFVGWPPPIPLNYEQQKTRSMVNIIAWGSMARPHRSVLKYPNYKKDVNPNTRVKVCQVAIKMNGETSKKNIINAFNYTLRKMALDRCHNYMLKFWNCNFFELIKAFC